MHLVSQVPHWGPTLSKRLPRQSPVHIQIDTQIKQALIERSIAYGLTSGQAPGHVIALNTSEIPLVQQLWHTRQLASRLSRSKVAQFSIIRKIAGAQLQATELGNEVLQLLSTSVGDVGLEYPCHVLEPRIELFLECAAKRNLLPLWPPFVPMEEARLLPLVDSLNGFAQDVRQRGSTVSFKAKIANFQAQTDKRYKAMQHYFRQLSTLYPEGHVIRMDFSYLPHQTVGFSFGEEMHKTVTLHGQALLEHLTKSWGSSVVGYAWKRDFAAARGYQYHLVAILNGPQVQELNCIEQYLGEHWCQSITNGLGLWFNCHGPWANDFRYRGVSAFKHCVGSMEEHLSLVPVFMALTDAIAAFKPLGKARPYGMGTLPAKESKKMALLMPQRSAIGNGTSLGSWPFSKYKGPV